jgi:hypothetical protein
MAQSERFDALVALGAVIRGETYHFEIVANDSCRGLMEVQLDSGVPIANGILTCEDDDQALARMQQKGADCAQVAVEMANLLAHSGSARDGRGPRRTRPTPKPLPPGRRVAGPASSPCRGSTSGS